MKLLLDTHAFIWWDNATLPKSVVLRIQRADEVFISAVTAWEIAIKSALGRMSARGTVDAAIRDYGFSALPIAVSHADAVRRLPAHHRDPFDRMLVAQALEEDLVLVSTDSTLRRYKAPVVWD